MSILFASNLARDVTGSAIAYQGAAQARDGAVNSEEIRLLVDSANATDKMQLPLLPASGRIWLHFRVLTTVGGTEATADGNILQLYSAGSLRGGISLNNGNWRAQIGANNYGAEWDIAPNTAYTIDFMFDMNGTNATAELYVDGALVSSVTVAYTLTTVDQIIFTMFDACGTTASPASYYISEIIVDDTDSTIGRRVQTMLPQADGANAGWEGDVTSLQTYSGDSYLYTESAQRHNWTLPAYGGATTGSVLAVVQASRGVRGSGGPTTLAQSLRVNSTDYDAASITPSAGKFTNFFNIWENNPDTALPWTFADLATIQGGVVAS